MIRSWCWRTPIGTWRWGSLRKRRRSMRRKEVRMPILVATITTVVVFAPVVFLSGIGRFLFTPLALSVTFAMLASYVVALTVVPAYCVRFLREAGGGPQAAFGKIQTAYGRSLESIL